MDTACITLKMALKYNNNAIFEFKENFVTTSN